MSAAARTPGDARQVTWEVRERAMSLFDIVTGDGVRIAECWSREIAERIVALHHEKLELAAE